MTPENDLSLARLAAALARIETAAQKLAASADRYGRLRSRTALALDQLDAVIASVAASGDH